MAWHIAALSRTDLNQYPLERLTGDTVPEQSAEQTLHAVRMWKAALANKEANQT